MKFSKATIRFVESLVSNFAHYDNLSECYNVTIDDLADFDIDHLIGLIMSDNPDWAAEANGPDNDNYDSMIASLQIYLKNSTDKDCEENFLSKWREGLTLYSRNQITNLLEIALEAYNHERAA